MPRSLADLKQLLEQRDHMSTEQLQETLGLIKAIAEKQGVLIGDPAEANPAELAYQQTHKRQYKYKYEKAAHLNLMAEEIRAFSDGERQEYKGLLVAMPPRHSKPLADSTPVLTTTGWKTHGELSTDDTVFSPDGRPVRVLEVGPQLTDEPTYELSFSDGPSILAGWKHEWPVAVDCECFWRAKKKGRHRHQALLETRELARAKKRTDASAVSTPPAFPEKTLPIEPYLLGCWLGDGTSAMGYIVAGEEDANHFSSLGIMRLVKPHYYLIHVPGLWRTLKQLGLYKNKHIPQEYLYSSVEQRLALLQGLLDTDGTCSKTGQVSFTSIKHHLADGVLSLCWSLGLKAYIREGRAVVSKKDCGPYWAVNFSPPPGFVAFRLARKQARVDAKPQRRGYVRYITAVTSASPVPMRCIRVEGGLYVAGRQHVPTHNSETLSVWTPLWLLKRNPRMRVILAAYGAEKAIEWGRDARDFCLQNPDFGLQLNPNVLAASGWQTVQGGGMWTAGVGGPLSGRGADCLVAGTLVVTDHGPLPIEAVVQEWYHVRVAGFDHETRTHSWRRVVGTRTIPAKRLVEVTTRSGRVIRATPDHRFCVLEQGYRSASALRQGDRLQCWEQDQAVQDLQAVREGCGESPSLQALLLRPETSGGHADLCPVWEGVSAARRRPRQVSAQRAEGCLLQPPVLVGASCSQEQQGLPNVRGAGDTRQVVLRASLLGKEEGWSAQTSSQGVSCLRQDLPAQISPYDLLLTGVREQAPLSQDGRQRELQLPAWRGVRQPVQEDASSHQTAGRGSVCGVPGQDDADARASHQRGHHGQPAGESGDVVQPAPHHPSQDEEDTVAMVREVCGDGQLVYDIQVEGTHNFFAEGLLVHNCLIVDDPYKDAAEAYSKVIRDKVRAWFNTVALTRLEPGGFICCIHTMWHQDDLINSLQRESLQGDGLSFKTIILPAIAGKNDILGRRLGDALWPERYPVPKLEEIRRGMSPYEWSALFQQNPTPEDGASVLRQWWKFYDPQESWRHYEEAEQVIFSFDLALKETEQGSFNVGLVLARKGAKTRIIDFWRQRCDFPTSLQKVRVWAVKYPKAVAKIVEDKAAGPAIISTFAKEIVGVMPMRPTGSKLVRLQAVIPLIEAGNVELPHTDGCKWSAEIVDECASFPSGQYDDIVDTLSQGLRYLHPQVWAYLDKQVREGVESAREEQAWSEEAEMQKAHTKYLRKAVEETARINGGQALRWQDPRRHLC